MEESARLYHLIQMIVPIFDHKTYFENNILLFISVYENVLWEHNVESQTTPWDYDESVKVWFTGTKAIVWLPECLCLLL